MLEGPEKVTRTGVTLNELADVFPAWSPRPRTIVISTRIPLIPPRYMDRFDQTSS